MSPVVWLAGAAVGLLGQAGVVAQPATVEIGGVAVPSDCPLARNEHPRLLFSRSELPRLRERIKTGIIRDDFEYLKRFVDDGLARGSERARSAIVSLGLLYHLTGDERYGQACREWVVEKGDFGVYAALGLYGYDLVYDLLTPEERRQCEQKSLDFLRRERWRPRARFMHALGIYGSGLDDGLVGQQIAELHPWMIERKQYLNEWAADRGGDGNSHGYIGQHEFVGIMGAFQAWKTCTGEDWFEGFDWAKHMAAYYVYHYLPDRHDTVHIGINCWGLKHIPGETQGENFCAIAPAKWQDGLGQWWVRNVIMERRHDYHVLGRFWGPILWLDPTVPEIPPGNFPPTMLFKTRGYVSMRSDWSPDALFAHFHCGRFESDSRNNADNNSFIIYRKGYLACDSGTRGMNNPELTEMSDGRHHNRYFIQTIAHNSITVGTEDIAGNGWTAVCGGQVSRPKREWLALWGLPATAEHLYEPQAGRILAYETSPAYDYVAGDASRSYSPAYVRVFTRQCLYVKPDLFIVCDRIESVQPEAAKRWYMHTMAEPGSDGEERPDRSLHREGHFLCSGQTFSTRYQGSVLHVTTLLPRDAVRRKLGGPGHQFEVNGENYDMYPRWYERLSPSFAESIGLGLWRIEVEPSRRQAKDVFLHVLRAGAEGTPAPRSELLEGAGQVGARVRRDDGSAEVWFATEGEVGGSIRLGDDEPGRELASAIEDHYGRWERDARYGAWTDDPYYRAVVAP